MTELDDWLQAAHKSGDSWELVRLYTLIADTKEREHDVDAACFFLTHAFVWALECDHPLVADLNARLVSYGREVPL